MAGQHVEEDLSGDLERLDRAARDHAGRAHRLVEQRPLAEPVGTLASGNPLRLSLAGPHQHVGAPMQQEVDLLTGRPLFEEQITGREAADAGLLEQTVELGEGQAAEGRGLLHPLQDVEALHIRIVSL
jgi:hypothetical protein